MAPYSILPNHVNPYYELIWLPMLIASGYVGITELMDEASTSYPKLRAIGSVVVLMLVVGMFVAIDYPGRKSIAAWYDGIAASNDKTIKLLRSKKDEINKLGNVSIVGTNSFSPWFMHGGGYLQNVLGLHARWYIILDADSPLYAGMLVGAKASNGQTVLVPSNTQIPEPCLHISLESLK